ncbi:hypothetical protein WMO24_12335 [Ruthenibacterium sp. CLA-JM-H11]|uniref:Uncharacterized protein n=1 Tax=Ruthenibacterium intestinale TaxID=3133163 RepID=A0ABV1GH75_9FIRM
MDAQQYLDAKGVIAVKQHRFWAWGAVICMIMVMVTGYKRK